MKKYSEFLFALECFGKRSSRWYCKLMFVSFILHSTTAEATIVDFGFHIFPSPCLYFSCVATVSHTFLPYEQSERATKWLNTLKYSERFRRSVGVRRSTWRDWKAVGSHSAGWNYFFCKEKDKKEKISNGWVVQKKYIKELNAGVLVFKEKLSQRKVS